MDKIRDIKPLVEISDYSFYLYLFLIVIFFLLLFIVFYKIVKIFSNKKIDNRKILIKKLKNIDFKDSKKAAYLITKIGRELVHDDRSYKIFEELLIRLQKYKYRKNPPKISEEVRRYLILFIETVDE